MTAAANEPIFEYDPLTLALRGMRWEMEQRTNNVLYSSENNAAWVAFNMTKSTALSIIPGKSSIVGTKTGPSGAVLQSGIGTYSGSAECAWVIVEQGTSPIAEFTAFNSTDSQHVAYVRLTFATGDVTKVGGGAITFGSQKLKNTGPNGGAVWLVWASYTATAGKVRRFNFYAAGASGVDGQYSVLHHTQFEAGSYPSSIIVTGAAAVIRQPDVLTANSISPWYNQSEGTVVFEGIHTATDATMRGHYVFNNGTNTNRILSVKSIANVPTGMIVASTTQMSQSLGTISSDVVFRTALAYKLNNSNYSVNGTLGIADTSCTVPAVNALTLGKHLTSAAGAFMGYARRFSYYNTRLPDSILQGLSRV